MANSSVVDQHNPANSSDSPSSNQDCATSASSSDLASPNYKRPTKAKPISPNRQKPAMSNASNQASREKSSDQASSPKRARIMANDDHSVVSVTEKDRISFLPERARIRILEHLPLRTAIESSQLSSRWHRLWQRMSKLFFDQWIQPPASKDFSVFSSFVDTVLLLCDPNSVRSIAFRFSAYDYDRKLPIWLEFVVNHKVEELKLHTDAGTLELPLALRHNCTIKTLYLDLEEIKYGGAGVYWGSLRKLTLDGVSFTHGDMLDEILSGCPVLEELELIKCSDVGFHCGNLLRYLRIDSCFDSQIFYVHNPPASLREVVLNCDWHYFEPTFDDQFSGYNHARDIICSLSKSDVEKLTLNGGCLELFTYCKDNILSSPLPRLRNLVLSLHFNDLEMPGLACMLRGCPNLETLVIDLNIDCGWMCGGKFITCTVIPVDPKVEVTKTCWMSQDISAFKCLRTSLKTVKVTGYGMYDCEEDNLLEFLEFILKHALMLEELLVVCDKGWDRETAKEQLADAAHTLLGFESSSPFVKMIFS